MIDRQNNKTLKNWIRNHPDQNKVQQLGGGGNDLNRNRKIMKDLIDSDFKDISPNQSKIQHKYYDKFPKQKKDDSSIIRFSDNSELSEEKK